MDNQAASTSSANITMDENAPVLLNEHDDVIYILENSTSATTNDTIESEQPIVIDILNIFGNAQWLIWVVVAIGVLIVISVVIAIITCIIWNKKRVIRRGSASDQKIIGSQDSTSHAGWPRWMVCCPKSVFERQERLNAMRQNSASNLDPYRRPPLPPISSVAQNGDGLQGTYIPPNRLEPIRLQQGDAQMHVDETANQNVLGNFYRDDELFGIQITAIKGVPVIQLSKDQRRTLPTPPSSGGS